RVSSQPGVRQRGTAEPERDEGPGTTPGTLGDPAEVVCDHHTGPAGRDHSPLRLEPRRPSGWPPTLWTPVQRTNYFPVIALDDERAIQTHAITITTRRALTSHHQPVFRVR